MATLTRRQLGKSAAAALMATAIGSTRVLGANDRVRVGFIGLGNRGDQVLDAFLAHKDCEIVAICDIYQPYLDFAAKKIGGQPRAFTRLPQAARDQGPRRGRHHHAGPLARAADDPRLPGRQGRLRREAAVAVRRRGPRRWSRPPAGTSASCRSGIQRRSSAFVPGGGRARPRRRHRQGDGVRVRSTSRTSGRRASATPPTASRPPDFDWDAWLGPAPGRPYNKNRTFYRFRWFYDYSGGQLTNFGVHYLDVDPLGARPRRAAGRHGDGRQVRQLRQPRGARHAGGALALPRRHAGDVLAVQRHRRPGGAQTRACEIEFRGTKGTLYLFSDGYEIVPDVITPNEFPARTPLDRAIRARLAHRREGADRAGEGHGRPRRHGDHARNFLDCVKSRADLRLRHRVRPPRAPPRRSSPTSPTGRSRIWSGTRGRAVHEQRGGQQVAELPLPVALQDAGPAGAEIRRQCVRATDRGGSFEGIIHAEIKGNTRGGSGRTFTGRSRDQGGQENWRINESVHRQESPDLLISL